MNKPFYLNYRELVDENSLLRSKLKIANKEISLYRKINIKKYAELHEEIRELKESRDGWINAYDEKAKNVRKLQAELAMYDDYEE